MANTCMVLSLGVELGPSQLRALNGLNSEIYYSPENTIYMFLVKHQMGATVDTLHPPESASRTIVKFGVGERLMSRC